MEYTPQEREQVIKALLKKTQYTQVEAQQVADFCLLLAPELLKIWARVMPKQRSNPTNQEEPP